MAARRSGSTTTRRACSAGTPATISSMMASGSSVRGLSEVTNTRSARRAPMAPMSGPLAAVAVAAATEHDQHAPAGEVARRQQRVLQRVGRVRVVHDHGERLPGAHRLEPARHALRACQAVDHGLERQAHGQHRRRRRQRVLDVEARRQGQLHILLHAQARDREREARTLGAQAQVGRLGVGRRLRRAAALVGDGERPQVVAVQRPAVIGEPSAVLVGHVDDRRRVRLALAVGQRRDDACRGSTRRGRRGSRGGRG